MALKRNPKKRKRNKNIIIVSALIFLIAAVGFSYYFIFAGNRLERQKLNLTVKTMSFYNKLVQQINTNKNWAGFIDEFATGDAKEDLSRDAVLLLDSANQGGQYIVRFASPLDVSIYNFSKDKAEVLVDFELGERIVGDPEKISMIKKFITFEKIDSEWKISEIMDRSDNFDKAVK
jgi:hypothetical protein